MTTSLYCLAPDYRSAQGFERPLVLDAGVPLVPLARTLGVVLGPHPESRAQSLLEHGAPRVYVSDAVLDDPDVLVRLSRHFGPRRVGLCLNVRRMPNQWSFETVSNADFKVVTPSVCQPTWELVRSDGTPAGTRLQQWVETVSKTGLAQVLVRVDIHDDDDLNLCAGLVEDLGDRVCLAPATQPQPSIDEWVNYGRARHIALPPALYVRYARTYVDEAT